MIRPLLLANENWPYPAVRGLRAAGLDVEAVAEVCPGVSDRAVLERAIKQPTWLLTFDRDYGALVFAGAVPPPLAIVFLRQARFRLDWPAQVVIELLERREWVDHHLIVVTGRNMRRKALPPP